MPKYAKTTTVSVEKTKAEIESTMRRWGVDGFMTAWEGDANIVAFKFRGLQARISLPMPDRGSEEIVRTPTGLLRWDDQQEKAYEQAIRQRWRALLLYLKATLEAIESGIISSEEAFLPYLVLPNGRTVTDSLMPGIYGSLEAGQMPPMLPEGR